MLTRMWRKGTTYLYLRRVQIHEALQKSVGRFLKKLRIDLSQEPAIPLLGTYQKDFKSTTEIFFSSMFTVPLFIRARNWKQPICSSAEEWILKMCRNNLGIHSKGLISLRRGMETVAPVDHSWPLLFLLFTNVPKCIPLFNQCTEYTFYYKYSYWKWHWKRKTVF